jgi:hypothetical protein
VNIIKSDGSAKSRLLAMGNFQTEDSVPNTYAPTAFIAGFKVLVQVVAHEDMELDYYDVDQALLQSCDSVDWFLLRVIHTWNPKALYRHPQMSKFTRRRLLKER